jgi:hypothetical protein
VDEAVRCNFRHRHEIARYRDGGEWSERSEITGSGPIKVIWTEPI